MHKILLFLLTPLFGFAIDITTFELAQKRAHEEGAIMKRCEKRIPLYDLKPGCFFEEITEKVYASTLFSASLKESAKSQSRRFFLFSHPSDKVMVKAFLSYIPSQSADLLLLLRGGNKLFGLPAPLNSLSLIPSCNIIIPAYRGSVGDGIDELGGDDINDILHLIHHIPMLEHKLGIMSQNKRYVLGRSRGAMQMFLALNKYPKLQTYFDKAISLSGMLDMETTLAERPILKKRFIKEFGLQIGLNDQAWIDRRSAIKNVQLIRKDLPILILQGLQDIRTSPIHGRKMKSTLQKINADVTLLEFESGNHCLQNIPQKRMKAITNFLQS